MLKIKKNKILFLIYILSVLQGCGIDKFIPEGELLYTGSTLEITNDSLIENQRSMKSELKSTLRPEPNKKSLNRYFGLHSYYKNQKEKPGFINKWIYKKIGEEPIYQSNVETIEIEQTLINRLENNGYFYSKAASNWQENEKKKTAFATYTVIVNKPYKLATYQLDTIAETISDAIKKSVDTTKFSNGMRFDLSAMKSERERIDGELKNNGFYNFNSEFLIFEADTNQYENRQFDLFLKLKKEVPKKALIPYKISKINVYSNYDIQRDSLRKDTLRYHNKNFIEVENFFKPEKLDPFIQLEEGQLYNSETSRNTARRISSIGVYKFVNIQYEEKPLHETDSIGFLEANIFLSPLTKMAIRAELQAVTKSNSFAGPALELTYSNRNFFNGGETLNLSTNVAYEVQFGGNQPKQSNTSVGFKSELIFPRVIFPYSFGDNFFKYSVPKTKTSLTIDFLDRTDYFTILSGQGQFGYIWNENKFTTHEINPISVNYTNLLKTSDEFDQILEDNPFYKKSFDQQFIAGLNYSFTYNGMLDNQNKHQFYVNTTYDMAGNILSLFGKNQGEDPSTILGLEYAQYVKADMDFRYHFNFGKDQKIATRLFGGYGYAYGNSDVLPYVKQYYSGGPNGVRAFHIRSLGPGTYTNPDNGDDTYIDQTGNIRLEANLEYRFPIFSYLKGALFVDAGNVWLSEESVDLPGGKFTSDFYKQLGIGAGIGARVDVQGFVIRFDWAAPINDPSLPEGERFDVRIDETIFNFAIGYPF